MEEPGVYFAVDENRVRIRATRRADLQIGRLGLHARRLAELEAVAGERTDRKILPTVMGVIVTPTFRSAEKLQRALERVWVTRKRETETEGLWFTLTEAEVMTALKRCGKQFGLKVQGVGLSLRQDKPKTGPMSVTRYYPDPSIAQSEKIVQMANLDRQRRAAQVKVEVKMSTLIGGLSRLGKLQEEHKQAAARLKTLHEQAQLGGARAVDYTAVKVDTSGMAENNIGEIGERARRDYKVATDSLGAQAELVEQVVIHGDTVSHIARARGLGAGGAARARVTNEVIEAVDDLARHFGLYAGAGRRKVETTKWAAGPRLPLDLPEEQPFEPTD